MVKISSLRRDVDKKESEEETKASVTKIESIKNMELKKQCPACSFRYFNLTVLRSHFEIFHFDLKVIQCDDCKKEVDGGLEGYLEHCSKPQLCKPEKPVEDADKPETETLTSVVEIGGMKKMRLTKQCPACPFKFRNLTNFRNHFKKFHCTLKQITCIYCSEKMNADIEAYLKHRITHQIRKPMLNADKPETKELASISEVEAIANMSLRKQCPACPYKFPNLDLFQTHFEKFHHDLQSIKCIHCSEEVNGGFQDYLKHRRIHQLRLPLKPGEQPKAKRECPLCHKVVQAGTIFRRHLGIHSRVPCSQCKALVNPHRMKQHINEIHTKERSYPCPDCPAVYYNDTGLLTHRKRNHMGDEVRRHACKVCMKKFISPCDLRIHVAGVHDNVKKHVCEFCGISFKLTSHLFYHRRKHTGEKPNECAICKKCFSNPSRLGNHVRKVHHVEYTGKYRKRLSAPKVKKDVTKEEKKGLEAKVEVKEEEEDDVSELLQEEHIIYGNEIEPQYEVKIICKEGNLN